MRANRQFFASTLLEQLFEIKNEDVIKNLRIQATHVLAKAYPLTLCMAGSILVKQFPYTRKATLYGTPQISRKFSLRVIVFNILVQVGSVIAYDT